MKRIIIILTCVLGVSATAYPQYFETNRSTNDRGLFNQWFVSDENYYGAFGGTAWSPYDPLTPNLPGHGQTDNQAAPLGGGTLLLVSLGAAYALKSRRRK